MTDREDISIGGRVRRETDSAGLVSLDFCPNQNPLTTFPSYSHWSLSPRAHQHKSNGLNSCGGQGLLAPAPPSAILHLTPHQGCRGTCRVTRSPSLGTDRAEPT